MSSFTLPNSSFVSSQAMRNVLHIVSLFQLCRQSLIVLLVFPLQPLSTFNYSIVLPCVTGINSLASQFCPTIRRKGFLKGFLFPCPISLQIFSSCHRPNLWCLAGCGAIHCDQRVRIVPHLCYTTYSFCI